MSAAKGYSATQIVLHWVVALLVGAQFLFNDAIGGAFRQMMQGNVPPFSPLVWGHIAGGFAILALALWRLSIRARRGAPEVPAGTPPMQHRAASTGHVVLYALMLALPVSGMVAWFGAVGPAGEAHEVLTNLLLAVLGLHVLAALYHQFIRRDGLLMRMLRPET